jgi:Protein of unknown function (DUF2946)
MRRLRQKTIAWIAAAALLFSALSPAMASVLFAERPDILARVLGVAAQHAAVMEQGDGCPHEAQAATTVAAGHGDASAHAPAQPATDPADHAAHGIYCSFCLAAAATVTLPGVPPAVAAVVPDALAVAPAAHSQPVVARLPSTHRSRAPPAFS